MKKQEKNKETAEIPMWEKVNTLGSESDEVEHRGRSMHSEVSSQLRPSNLRGNPKGFSGYCIL